MGEGRPLPLDLPAPAGGLHAGGWYRLQMRLHAASVAGLRPCLLVEDAGTPCADEACVSLPPVARDGRVMQHGSRRHYDPASEVYREHSRRITTEVAQRYGVFLDAAGIATRSTFIIDKAGVVRWSVVTAGEARSTDDYRAALADLA